MRKIFQKENVITLQLELIKAYLEALESNNEQMVEALKEIIILFEELFDLQFREILK